MPSASACPTPANFHVIGDTVIRLTGELSFCTPGPWTGVESNGVNREHSPDESRFSPHVAKRLEQMHEAKATRPDTVERPESNWQQVEFMLMVPNTPSHRELWDGIAPSGLTRPSWSNIAPLLQQDITNGISIPLKQCQSCLPTTNTVCGSRHVNSGFSNLQVALQLGQDCCKSATQRGSVRWSRLRS